MIALPDRMPLVCHRGSYQAPFERDWVDNSLKSAARAAGYDHWWLAPHVAEGVSNYLGEHHSGTVVTTDEVERTIRRILADIGYAEVAREVSMAPPPIEIALPLLAERAVAELYELAFFQELDAEITTWLGRGANNIRFSGLRYAVKRLVDARRWRQSCALLRDEVLAFLCTRMKGSNDAPVAFTVS